MLHLHYLKLTKYQILTVYVRSAVQQLVAFFEEKNNSNIILLCTRSNILNKKILPFQEQHHCRCRSVQPHSFSNSQSCYAHLVTFITNIIFIDIIIWCFHTFLFLLFSFYICHLKNVTFWVLSLTYAFQHKSTSKAKLS